MALKAKIQQGVRELNISVRKADYAMIVERAITIITTPSDDMLHELKLRHSAFAERRRR
jgi:hypothetical protein